MIDSLSITDIKGKKFSFTIGESPPTQLYPVQKWDPQIELRNTRQPHMQAHGNWPGPTYMGACVITVEGAVFGDTYEHFNENLIALKAAVHPVPSIVARDNNKVGTLRIKPTGMNMLQADVTLESFICPLDGNTYAEWQLVWVAFDPFFVETMSSKRILL